MLSAIGKERMLRVKTIVRIGSLWLLWGGLLFNGLDGWAQSLPFAGALDQAPPDGSVPIEVDAESMNYDRQNGRIVAAGNVVIVSGLDRLRADRVLVNVNSGDLYAIGNVELERDGEIIRGEKLHYNTKTRVSSLDTPRIDSEPFHMIAENVTRTAENTFRLQGAKVTTCIHDHDHAHYHVRARDLKVVPGEHLTAKHAVWYFGRVPVLYLPYWRRRLHDEYGWVFYPGYRSRWGGYLLSSFFHRVSPNLRFQHHLDYYTDRGFGLGETIDWRTPGGQGKLALYYINDDKPLGDNPPPDPPEVDEGRYRLFLRHDEQLTDQTRLMLRNEYVSDATFRRDFFDREYRRLRQPENYVTLSHQADLYTLSALAYYRLNDFHGNVNRLPELALNWYRMQLGDTSFYYESRSTAAFLERLYPSEDASEAYSSVRVDSWHSIYQPRRIAGWLNVVPRASYRGTYYSNSRETDTQEIVSVRNVTNELTLAVATVRETNTVTQVREGGMQFRQVLEVGSEVSFKAFKRLADSPGGQPWRHVVEPYLNYSLRFDPTVDPGELYDYDDIDRIDGLHAARIGVRNLLQTKWDGRSVEAVDVNVWTTANLDPDEDEDTFQTLSMQTRLRPSRWIQIDADGVYDVSAATLSTLNSRFALADQDQWRVGVEHRFRDAASNLLIFDATFAPNQEWDLNVFSRYEFEVSRLEEQGGYVQRNFDCMSVRLGGSVLPGFTRTDGTREEADYRVLLAFWLTAFPEMGLNANGR